MNYNTSAAFSFSAPPSSSSSNHSLLKPGRDHAIVNGHEERSISLSAKPGFVSAEFNNGGAGLAKFKLAPSSYSPFFSIAGGLSHGELLGSPMLLSSSNMKASEEAENFHSQAAFNWKNNNINYNQGIMEESKSYLDISFQTSTRTPSLQPSSFIPSSTGQLMSSEKEGLREIQQLWSYKYPTESNSSMIPLATQPCSSHEQSEHISTSIMAAHALSDQRGAEDGYNWRKYGQKQVKGSENPRNYYKCTYPNCPSKKKVEKTLEGQITEIIYKGKHNHAKPKPTRRNSSCFGSDQAFLNSQVLDSIATTDLEHSSASYGDNDLYMNSMKIKSQGDGFDEDEPDWKKMKIDSDENEEMSGNRNMRTHKVVIQTTSDMDILDDGYRWRKYGQKVVKGNPNPRSYYKCTASCCPVRKHVERASTDLKAVITTYEGKHTHDVPPPRGNASVASKPSLLDNSFYNFNNVTIMPTRPMALPTHVISQVANDSFFGSRTNFAMDNFAFSRFDNSLGAFYGNQQHHQ